MLISEITPDTRSTGNSKAEEETMGTSPSIQDRDDSAYGGPKGGWVVSACVSARTRATCWPISAFRFQKAVHRRQIKELSNRAAIPESVERYYVLALVRRSTFCWRVFLDFLSELEALSLSQAVQPHPPLQRSPFPVIATIGFEAS